MDKNNLKPNKNIIEIKNGDKNIDLQVILVKILKVNNLKNGNKITTYQVADESGSIHCNFFDNVSDFIKEGDILFITGAYSSLFEDHIVLYQPKIGHGHVTKIGEFFFTFSLKPNISEPKISQQNNNI